MTKHKLLGAGLLAVAAQIAGSAWGLDIRPAVSGTAHEALFAVAAGKSAAIAVGAAGDIMMSHDEGVSWSAVQAPPTPLALLGVALQDGHAIAVGQEGSVFTSDLQGAWLPATSGTENRLFGVALNAHGQAVSVGAFGTILLSNDFGRSWHTAAPDWTSYTKDGEEPHLYDATIDDNGVVTVAGEFGLILRTTDGHVWQTLHKGDASLFALNFRAGGTGYAVGQDGAILRSVDGGATWQDLHSGTGAILLGVRSDSDGHVVVSGMHDMLASNDDGKNWVHVPGRRFASSWYQGVAETPKTWLVVGNNGQILRMDK